MATNFEFYKDEILKIAQRDTIPTLVKGKLVGCFSVECNECDFRSSKCRKERIEWLYAEHIEQPKLTKRERAFCEAVGEGWIVKDACSECYWVDSEPSRTNMGWEVEGHDYVRITPYRLFDFIKRDDAEPWAVEDLLKLEVIEE